MGEAVTTEPCRKVRSGMGAGYACRTHGRPWPCNAPQQPAEQLMLLPDASLAALIEVASQLVYHREVLPEGIDAGKQAQDWVDLIVEYLNRANLEARLQATREAEGAPPDPGEWRRRLIQVAAIALDGVAWIDAR